MAIAPSTLFAETLRTTGRSVGAVVAGLLSVIVLSTGVDAVLHLASVFPPAGEVMSNGLFVLATAYRVVFAVLGGYITARLAPRDPMRHALILGGIGCMLSLAGVLATVGRGPEFGPLWYPLVILATAVPCPWLGAKLQAR